VEGALSDAVEPTSGPSRLSELLAGRAAIVTGAAQGIGLATARTLVAHGARVLLADVDDARVRAAAGEIGAGAAAFAGDLVVPGVPDAMVARAVEAFGQLDIVVNNAGYHWDAPLHRMSDEQFQAMLDVHMVVPFRVLRAAAPHLREPAKREAEQGIERFRKVVNVSSLAASFGNPGAANYAAAKAGLIGLTRAAAREWGPLKINVNAVAFGVIQTRLGQPQGERNVVRSGGREVAVGVPVRTLRAMGIEVDPDREAPEDEVYSPRAMRQVPLGRAGTVQEAANAIFYLCSPLSDYVHGQVHVVSGGIPGGMS
jgi:3-oxoacyl-[acyl-carrier protein] reductase